MPRLMGGRGLKWLIQYWSCEMSNSTTILTLLLDTATDTKLFLCTCSMQAHTVDIYKDSISNILRSKNKAGAKYFLTLDFDHFPQVCHYSLPPWKKPFKYRYDVVKDQLTITAWKYPSLLWITTVLKLLPPLSWTCDNRNVLWASVSFVPISHYDILINLLIHCM